MRRGGKCGPRLVELEGAAAPRDGVGNAHELARGVEGRLPAVEPELDGLCWERKGVPVCHCAQAQCRSDSAAAAPHAYTHTWHDVRK